MQARNITVLKTPIGITIELKEENRPSTGVMLERLEWEWVQETAEELDVGTSETKTFVL